MGKRFRPPWRGELLEGGPQRVSFPIDLDMPLSCPQPRPCPPAGPVSGVSGPRKVNPTDPQDWRRTHKQETLREKGVWK